MAETATSWAPRGAWAGIAEADHFGAAGSGVIVQVLDGLGLATLIVSEGGNTASATLEGRLGLALPMTPNVADGASGTAIWSGPGQWLLRAAPRDGFAELLSDLAGHAAVSDQSVSRAVLRVSGPRVRDVLAKGVMIDLHPGTFAIGAVALTSIAHIGVQLWRCEDGPDGAVFELLVPRSMAASFWSWFSASAAEYGCVVTTGQG